MSGGGKRGRSSCPSASALEIMGDRWTLLLIREFVFNGRREYGHFLQMMEGVSTNVLADRLTRLVRAGLFTKHPHPTNQKKSYYEITEKGFDLVPVLMELSEWGEKHLPGTQAPREIRNLFRRDRAGFRRQWRQRVRERSRAYRAEAEAGGSAR